LRMREVVVEALARIHKHGRLREIRPFEWS
jgi:hypothetical protein